MIAILHFLLLSQPRIIPYHLPFLKLRIHDWEIPPEFVVHSTTVMFTPIPIVEIGNSVLYISISNVCIVSPKPGGLVRMSAVLE